jgi:hypothetical protein
MYIEELSEFLFKNNIKLRIAYNHVHGPDYLMATILPKKVRQEKLLSIKSKIPQFNYNDLYGHYFESERNLESSEYFKFFNNELDKIRDENLEEHFSKLIEVL